MNETLEAPIFLTVRGHARPESVDAARALHNRTAGAPEGIAAARSLGDLSHKVYVPVPSEMSSAKPDELLFHDFWENPAGLMQFFSNAHVAEQGAHLFRERDAAVWMPARGSFTFHFPAPSQRGDRFVGMIRGAIGSPERAIAAFAASQRKGLRDARRRGQLSHELFIKLNPPGVEAPLEVLGVDLWCDAAGMAEHYSSMDMAALAPIFTGRPDPTIWRQAPGDWAEW